MLMFSPRHLRIASVVIFLHRTDDRLTPIAEIVEESSKETTIEPLFRFDALRLGPGFEQLVDQFDDWITPPGGTVDEQGADHARKFVEHAERYHNDCYQPPDQQLYTQLEAERKKLEHSAKLHDKAEMRELHAYFSNSTHDVEDLVAYSGDSKWTWRPAGLFSSRGGNGRNDFRTKLQLSLEKYLGNDWEGARVSGTYWYPPGGVREWHTNARDVEARPYRNQVWRMYYVRLKQATEAASSNWTTESAMHVLEHAATGINESIMRRAGAVPSTNDGTRQQPRVWRLPDRNGHVTFFRLPQTWHCIVSETAHRFSLGFALTDAEVKSILSRAEIGFSTTTARSSSS